MHQCDCDRFHGHKHQGSLQGPGTQPRCKMHTAVVQIGAVLSNLSLGNIEADNYTPNICTGMGVVTYELASWQKWSHQQGGRTDDSV